MESPHSRRSCLFIQVLLGMNNQDTRNHNYMCDIYIIIDILSSMGRERERDTQREPEHLSFFKTLISCTHGKRCGMQYADNHYRSINHNNQ